MKTLRTAALIVALAGFSAPLHAQVVNGGFETGDLTGWNTAGNCSFTGVTSGGGQHSGLSAMFAGPIGSTCTISQSVATTIGQQYTFSFWVMNEGAGSNSFEALFGGVSQVSMTNAAPFNYTQQSFNVTATGASSTIAFVIRHDPSFYYVDDVSLTSANTTVPEPSTYALMAAGLAGLGLAAKRRRKA